MFYSKQNYDKGPRGFSLAEVTVALMILALISSTVLVAINRYSEMTINRQLGMQAFFMARENMEKILASDTVEETLEYTSSDQNPDIQASSVVETFYDRQTQRLWIRAICSASFIDSMEQEQTIELTHWVTDLSAEQMLKVLEFREWQKQQQQQALLLGSTYPTQAGTSPGGSSSGSTGGSSSGSTGGSSSGSTGGSSSGSTWGSSSGSTGGRTREWPDRITTTTSRTGNTTTTSKQKQPSWLPDGFFDWPPEEQLNWLLGTLRRR